MRRLGTGQDECLTICLSLIRNGTKQSLSWHPRECQAMREDACFFYWAANFLWGSPCLSACPVRQRPNSGFRETQVESKLLDIFLKEAVSFALLPQSFCHVLKAKLALFPSFSSFWYGVLQDAGCIVADTKKREISSWAAFWMKAWLPKKSFSFVMKRLLAPLHSGVWVDDSSSQICALAMLCVFLFCFSQCHARWWQEESLTRIVKLSGFLSYQNCAVSKLIFQPQLGTYWIDKQVKRSPYLWVPAFIQQL